MNNLIIRIFTALTFLVSCSNTFANSAPKSTLNQFNIIYSGPQSPENPCRLDVYLPKKSHELSPVLIWFHGGSLNSGTKDFAANVAFAKFWQSKGIAVINVDYRLSPQVKYPTYIEDAAAAVAWTFSHAKILGLDRQQLFVGGHSAGAYLATMLSLDSRYLNAQKIDPNQVAGFISLSGQMSTHFTVRKDLGLNDVALVVNEAAPFYYVRQETPRLLLLIGDDDWPARLEENQLIYAQFQKMAKNKNVSFQLIQNRTHNSIYERIPENQDETFLAFKDFMNLKIRN